MFIILGDDQVLFPVGIIQWSGNLFFFFFHTIFSHPEKPPATSVHHTRSRGFIHI